MLRIPIFILFLGIFGLDLYAQGNSPTITQKNGKYGLIDENGNVLVENECDTIYSNSGDYKNAQDIFGIIRPFFILKKSSKYAYAYNSSKDYIIHEPLPDNQWQWVVSDFSYDDLQQYRFEDKFYIFAVKYRIKNKWGILYSYYTRVRDSKLYFGLSYLPSGFAKLQATEAVYDSIGKRYEDGILDVVKNGKYSLLYLSPPNAHIEYGGDFDTVPLLIYTGINDYVHFSRMVKKNGKWGIVKLNTEKGEAEYVVPCNCDTVWDGRFRDPKSNIKSDIVFLCEKRAQQKAVLYDVKDTLTISIINKLPINHFGGGALIDTIPDEKEGTYKKYALIDFGTYQKSKGLLNLGFCLVEVQSGKTSFYIDDDSTTYEIFFGYHGIMIEKQVKIETGIIYEYIDFETGQQKLALKSQKNISYRVFGVVYHESQDDYLLIKMIKEKKGEKEYTYKYYYDFRTKKFYKGRCKECQ